MKLIHNVIFIQYIDTVCIDPRVRLILQFYCQISANISIMEYLRHIYISLSLKYTKYINGSTIIIDENSPLTPSDVRWTQPSFPITVTISQYRCKFFCTPRNHPTSEENVPRREINSMSRLKQSVEPCPRRRLRRRRRRRNDVEIYYLWRKRHRWIFGISSPRGLIPRHNFDANSHGFNPHP